MKSVMWNFIVVLCLVSGVFCGRVEDRMMTAIMHNDLDEMVESIAYGPDVNFRFPNDDTVLLAAIREDMTGAIGYLLGAGMMIEQHNHYEMSAVAYAASLGRHEMLQIMADFGAVNHFHDVTDEGWTTMHYAAAGDTEDHARTVELLLRHDVPAAAENHQGQTPLDLATNEYVRVILEEATRGEEL
eukprot:TRINITY_DN74729_c0_g1_i1.p1 TRINITY_DN74729_c0_g1~~TRINITY_DN74729_c0_g1_i1.p1  ORF type:complete len:186 (+),score=23.28 TRINITY_DN74729_c0_g1_i1:73-630(+)